jgi:hypothetical protein
MKVCGVDLRGSEAIVAIVDIGTESLSYCDGATKKIVLGDDRDSSAIQSFKSSVDAFAKENAIELFAIRSRAKKGPMSGGAVSFKMETVFQLSGIKCEFVSPQAITSRQKRDPITFPASLNSYQHDAYACAVISR